MPKRVEKHALQYVWPKRTKLTQGVNNPTESHAVLIDDERKSDISKLAQRSKNWREYCKDEIDDKSYIGMQKNMKIEDERPSIIKKDYNNKNDIKRPIALIPDRCKCNDCQITEHRYFSTVQKYKVIKRSRHMQGKDTEHLGESLAEGVTQKRKQSYFIDQMLTDKPLDVDDIHEQGQNFENEKRLLGTEFNNPPYSSSSTNHLPRRHKIFRCHHESDMGNESDDQKREFHKDSFNKVERFTEQKQSFLHFHRKDIGRHATETRKTDVIKQIAICRCQECSKATTTGLKKSGKEISQWPMKKPSCFNFQEQILARQNLKDENTRIQAEHGSPWIVRCYRPSTRYQNWNEDDAKSNVKLLNETDDDCTWVKKVSKERAGIKENRGEGAGYSDIKVNETTAEENFNESTQNKLQEGEKKNEHEGKVEKEDNLTDLNFNGNGYHDSRSKGNKVLMKQEKDSGKKSRALANWLERKRVAELNDAFERLRKMVPTYGNEDRSLSKIKTLRYATTYIGHLALIYDKQCRFGINDLKNGLMKVVEIDPMLQRCQEHLETHCII